MSNQSRAGGRNQPAFDLTIKALDDRASTVRAIITTARLLLMTTPLPHGDKLEIVDGIDAAHLALDELKGQLQAAIVERDADEANTVHIGEPWRGHQP